MSITSEGSWRKSIAGGVSLVILAPAASIFLVNALNFLLPFLVSWLMRERDYEPESAFAFQALAQAWIGLVPVLLTVPLAIGVWRCTPVSSLEPPIIASRFRLALRGLVVAYAVVLGAGALWRFWPEAEGRFVLGWIVNALWWAFVLVGLAYVGRLFARLAQDPLARRSRRVAVVYVILVAFGIGFFYVMNSVLPDHLDGGIETGIWALAYLLPIALLQVGLFLLLGGLLWKLRRVLLEERGQAEACA